MPHCTRPCLIADSLSYVTGTEQVLFEQISVSVAAGDRIALVGKNGIGKSTLLKLLAGQLPPTTGTVSSSASSVYVPQLRLRSPNAQSVLDFLSTATDTWWEIEHLLETRFHTTLDLAAPMQALSGGERMQIALAIALWQSPELLLLDEPTNHLDYLAQEQLSLALSQFKGALIVVSHKPFFLDKTANTIWDLTASGLRVFGGNYSFYRAQKQLEREAAERSHETARKQLKRARATAQGEQQRAAYSNRNATRHKLTNRVARGAYGTMRNWAEVSAGKQKVVHEKAVETAAHKVEETKVHVHKATSIQIAAKSKKHRHLVSIREAALWVDQQQLIENVCLQIESGDRIAIAGPNGSGKSSLMKAIVGMTADVSARLVGGSQQIAAMKTVYLDQRYALIDRTQTVLGNMRRVNPTIEYQLLRQQLGHFLFSNDEVYKPAAVLSGGEMARCAIALITVSELDLLILDEPTNNLDIATVTQLIDALNEYSGALCVISHNLDFLSRINITRSFCLSQSALVPTNHLPAETSFYYNELLQRDFCDATCGYT